MHKAFNCCRNFTSNLSICFLILSFCQIRYSALGVTTTTIENGVIWGCGSAKEIIGPTEITKPIDPKNGALLVIGGVFYFFTVNAYYSEAAKRLKTTVEDLKKLADAAGTKVSSPLATVGGILGIVGGLSVCGGALLSKD